MTAVLAFFGAALGSGLSGWLVVRGQRQDARREWRERFDRAVGLMLGPSALEREIGGELLGELMVSDLGSTADRALATRVADVRVRFRDPRPGSSTRT